MLKNISAAKRMVIIPMINIKEKTLVLAKPDAVQRGLLGEIISRFEKRGLLLVAARLCQVNRDFAERHYAIHKGKPFYEGLVKYIVSAPVLAMIWEGENAVTAVRQTVGATNPLEASPGTIRHDLAILTSRNLIHASDSRENAECEISLWFDASEIHEWELTDDQWVYGKN
jgi:nucleoside-diphosphate kinase